MKPESHQFCQGPICSGFFFIENSLSKFTVDQSSQFNTWFSGFSKFSRGDLQWFLGDNGYHNWIAYISDISIIQAAVRSLVRLIKTECSSDWSKSYINTENYRSMINSRRLRGIPSNTNKPSLYLTSRLNTRCSIILEGFMR